MQAILINLALVSSLIIIGEIIAFLKIIKPNILRKFMHVGAGLIIILGSYLTNFKVFIIVSLITIVILTTARFIMPLKSVQDRASESFGEIYFAIGTLTLAIFCQNLDQFTIGVLVLTLADTGAYIVGRHIKPHYLRPGKTLAGFIACFIVTVFILKAYNYSLFLTFGIATYLAVTETLSDNGTDNLTIPIIYIILLNYIGLFS